MAIALLLALVALASWWSWAQPDSDSPVSIGHSTHSDTSSMICPWREPAADVQRFFGAADRVDRETVILSGQRLELIRALRRDPTSAELILRLHRVYARGKLAGYIVTDRAKGEFGAVELVLALNPAGNIQGMRIQRSREPDETTRWMGSARWQSRFTGRAAGDDLSSAVAGSPPETRTTVQNVTGAVSALLERWQVAQTASGPRTHTDESGVLNGGKGEAHPA